MIKGKIIEKRSANFLILVPHPKAHGGIANLYIILKNKFDSNVIYFIRGKRSFPYSKGFFQEIARLLIDYFIFFISIFIKKIDLVQTTTSFSQKSLYRDSVFINLAKLFKRKTIVFFHGWQSNYERKFLRSKYLIKTYLNTDAAIVLSSKQKKILFEMGYKNEVYIETTAFEDNMIKNFDINSIKKKYSNIEKSKIRILFLSRIEKVKGIFELIDAFQIINKTHDFELIIAGDGLVKNDVKKEVIRKNIDNIEFIGFVEDNDKIETFLDSHIYILPSYSEGMPCSVIEAMAMGLPVLVTEVGGLVDFFRNGINGFFIEKYNPNSIIEGINKLLVDKRLLIEMALYNHDYALKNFLASNVAKRTMGIFQKVFNEE